MKEHESKVLRATANAAVTKWRDAVEASTAAANALAEGRIKIAKYGGDAAESRVKLIELERAHYLAIDDARVAERDATLACDAADRAEGNAAALKIGPSDLLATIEAGLATIEERRNALAAAERSLFNAVADARAAGDVLTEARRAAGLPRPLAVPSASTMHALVAALKEGPKNLRHNENRIRSLDAESTRLRAELERAERREAEAQRERQRLEADRRAAEQAAHRAAREKNEALDRAAAERAAEERELAAAWSNRGGAA